MAIVLLDTHAWAWAFAEPYRLSAGARTALDGSGVVLVSPVSIYEIGQKARLGKWPAMDPYLPDLPDLLARKKGQVADLSPEIALLAATLDWPHRDPFDRMIAASAIRHGAKLVSADAAFDGLAGTKDWPGRVW